MFLKKREKIEWPFIVLGVLVILLLVAAAASILFFAVQNGNGLRDVNNQESVGAHDSEADNMQSEEDIYENYRKEVAGLQIRVQSDTYTDAEKLFADIEQVFLSTPVPVNFRDMHLETFLEIKALQKDQDSITLEEIKEQVDNLLEELVTVTAN